MATTSSGRPMWAMGMLAAMLFFHEQIPLTRWIGIALIMAGCVLIAR